jgi:Fe(3+) dicitrate transport protein
MTRALLLGGLIGGTGLVPMASGQGADAPYELAPVEVIGEPEALFRLPGSGYRVDGTVIEDYQLDDINRLLQRVPGVYIREEDGFGLLPNISLRGVDTSRSAKLTLMEDGIPTAPAPYSAPAAYYSPTLGRMAGVEVLKGTSQVRFGPHTTGGVINYLSTPLAGRRAGYLRLSAGEDGEFQIHGWLGDRWKAFDGDLDILVEGYGRKNDGFQRIAPGGTYPGSGETGFEREDGMLKLGWGSEDGRHRLEFKIGASHLSADLSYLGLSEADFAEDPYQRYAASREDIFDTNHSRSYLRYGLRLSNDWKVSWVGYYNTFHRNWYKLNDIRDLDLDGDGIVERDAGNSPVRMGLSQAIAGDKDGAGLEALKGERAANFRVRANNRDYYLAGTEATLSGTIENGEWTHSPLFGARFHTDRIRRLQWHDLYAQDASGSWADPVRSALGSDGNRRQMTESLALFAEDEITNGSWIFRPGVRVEFLDLSYEDFTTDGTNQRINKETDSMEVWSAGIAATRVLDEQRALFFNIYRGYSVPDPRSAIRGGIKEETSNSAELGFRYRNQETGLAAEMVGFYTHYSDLIVIDNIGSGASGGNDQQPVTENVGEVNSYGLELLVTGDLYTSRDGNWRMPASLTATWTIAELDGDSRSSDAESIFAGGKDGNRLPYIPELSLNLSLGIETDNWSTGLSLSWRDSTWSTATETGGQVNPITGEPDARYGRIDSVLLLDWNIRYVINESISVFATVNNLLDSEHLVSRHPHGARPGAPRQAAAGVTFTF